MAYPGLVLANAALGEGVETHVFFTFWGFDMITKSRMHGSEVQSGRQRCHAPVRWPIFDCHRLGAVTGHDAWPPACEEVDR